MPHGTSEGVMAGRAKKAKVRPNGVPSSKNPVVQRLYAELERIESETLDLDNCHVRSCRDRIQVLKQRTAALSDLFLLMLADQGALGE